MPTPDEHANPPTKARVHCDATWPMSYLGAGPILSPAAAVLLVLFFRLAEKRGPGAGRR